MCPLSANALSSLETSNTFILHFSFLHSAAHKLTLFIPFHPSFKARLSLKFVSRIAILILLFFSQNLLVHSLPLSLCHLHIHLLFSQSICHSPPLSTSCPFSVYIPVTLTPLLCPGHVFSVPAGMKVLNVLSLTHTHIHTLYPRASTNTRNQFSIYSGVGNLPAPSKNYLPLQS